jgi:hypothetical protein
MSALLHTAASITPPVLGRNIWRLPGTAASQRVNIPEEWRDCYLTFKAVGDTFHLAFGKSDVACVIATASSIAGEVITQSTPSDRIADGGKEDYDMRQCAADVTDFAFIGTGTAGYLLITRTSGKVSAD